jgi:hypothetical protein
MDGRHAGDTERFCEFALNRPRGNDHFVRRAVPRAVPRPVPHAFGREVVLVAAKGGAGKTHGTR